MQARSAVLLASAFSEFISASSRLENSYRQLQEEVSELRRGVVGAECGPEHQPCRKRTHAAGSAADRGLDALRCIGPRSPGGDLDDQSRKRTAAWDLNGSHFPEGSKATLRQISALSGVNLESSYENESSNDTGQEFCVHEPSGKRWLEVRNRPLFHNQAGDASLTGRS